MVTQKTSRFPLPTAKQSNGKSKGFSGNVRTFSSFNMTEEAVEDSVQRRCKVSFKSDFKSGREVGVGGRNFARGSSAILS